MTGYSKLAKLFAVFPQLISVRKFRELTSLLLLHQQAELIRLERKLEVCTKGDAADASLGNIDASWKAMQKAFDENQADMRMDLLARIDEKLKLYHKSIIRFKQIEACSPPPKYHVDSLNRWLSLEGGGNNFLRSFEADPWEKSAEGELVSILPSGDFLDHRLAATLSRPFHNMIGHRQKPSVDVELGLGSLWEYKDKHFSFVAGLLCAILSSIIPLASIFTLYFVNSALQRLMIISLFTLLFACTLQLTTRCRRAEIFAATSAFAAVQVVFLQGVNGYGQGQSL